MKKYLAFTAIIILFVGIILFIYFFKNNNEYSNIKYNEDLLKLSKNFENKEKTLCREIPNEKIFIPNYFLTTAGRIFFYDDINGFVKIENVQQTKYGFNIIFISQNQTLLIATKPDGQITNMAILGKSLYKSKDCLKIKEGMSLQDVKYIFPDCRLITEHSEIIDSLSSTCEYPYIEIVCDDGKNFVFNFYEKNGTYFVKNILNFSFHNEAIIKSWKKLTE